MIYLIKKHNNNTAPGRYYENVLGYVGSEAWAKQLVDSFNRQCKTHHIYEYEEVAKFVPFEELVCQES